MASFWLTGKRAAVSEYPNRQVGDFSVSAYENSARRIIRPQAGIERDLGCFQFQPAAGGGTALTSRRQNLKDPQPAGWGIPDVARGPLPVPRT